MMFVSLLNKDTTLHAAQKIKSLKTKQKKKQNLNSVWQRKQSIIWYINNPSTMGFTDMWHGQAFRVPCSRSVFWFKCSSKILISCYCPFWWQTLWFLHDKTSSMPNTPNFIVKLVSMYRCEYIKFKCVYMCHSMFCLIWIKTEMKKGDIIPVWLCRHNKWLPFEIS